MTAYELDIAADQVVQWLKEERATGRRALDIRATREYLAERSEDFEKDGLEDDTQASSLVTIGLLEVRPDAAQDGWRLEIRVEDIVGPHTPEERSVPAGPEEIDLADFELQFILPERGTAFVSLETETPEAKRRFERLFEDVLRDRHQV